MKRLLCVFLFLAIASSATASIRIEKIVAGLDSYVRGERWIPVIIEVRNTGENFQGTIEILRGETVFRKSLDLGSGASRRIEMLIYMTSYFEALKYQILDNQGRKVREDKIETRSLNYQDNLVLVISDSDYNHQFLNGVQNPWGGKTYVAYLKSGEAYTESLSYSVADAIALGDFSLPEMEPAKRRALLIAAAEGGTFVLSSATNHTILQEPGIGRALPEIHAELTDVSHGEFLVSRWTSQPNATEFPSFTIPIQTVRPGPSQRVLVSLTPDTGLVTSSPFYKGSILYFAFDYTRIPEEVRAIFPGYWNDLLHPTSSSPPAFGMPFRQRPEDNPRAQQFLYDIPGLRMPDIKWFSLFFFVYLMAIGPLQYFILTRLKKNALLWSTFPLIILIFTSCAIGYSKYRRTGNHNIRHVQIVEVYTGLNTQTRYQGFGTALSSSGKFSFQAVPENSFMTKSAQQSFSYLPEPYVFSENLPHEIVGENIKTWAYRTFDATSMEPQTMALEVTAHIDGASLVGKVKNNGQHDLKEAFFVYDNKNTSIIGTIPAGAERSFSLELNNASPPPFAENHLRGLLNLYTPALSSPHFLFGQIQDENGEIIINGTKEKTECLQYVAMYTNVYEAGPVNQWTPAYGGVTYR